MSDIESRQRLFDARARADVARMNFTASINDVRERLTPDHLKQHAADAVSERIEGVKDNFRTAIRQHPVLTAAAVIGGVVLLFWSPARFVLLYSMRGARLLWLNRFLWSSRDDN